MNNKRWLETAAPHLRARRFLKDLEASGGIVFPGEVYGDLTDLIIQVQKEIEEAYAPALADLRASTDEVARLRARVAELRAALRPFTLPRWMIGETQPPDDYKLLDGRATGTHLTCAHVRKARRAIDSTNEERR
jgi:hypothetical protein